MPTALLAWQLGGGTGHLMQMLPIAQGLIAQGHGVYVAFRSPARAASIFGHVGVRFLPVPFNTDGTRAFANIGCSFAHLLANTGFGSDHELFGLASAWRNLFRLARPDLLVVDHSPIALLASRGLPMRRAIVGFGFFTPPNVYPLPLIKAAPVTMEPARVAADEDRILGRVNWLLNLWKQRPLKRLSDLYHDLIDETFLTTFPELDHFPGRNPAPRYWGPINGSGGKPPQWPDAPGRKVFAYLKPCPALRPMLQVLRERAIPTLVYCPDIGAKSRKALAGPTIRFETQRLDPALLARDCDAAILHGTHGTLCDVLLAGKPVLNLPRFAEQQLLSDASARLGASLTISPRETDRAKMEAAIDRLLGDPALAAAAQGFARAHEAFSPAQQTRQILARLHQLVNSST